MKWLLKSPYSSISHGPTYLCKSDLGTSQPNRSLSDIKSHIGPSLSYNAHLPQFIHSADSPMLWLTLEVHGVMGPTWVHTRVYSWQPCVVTHRGKMDHHHWSSRDSHDLKGGHTESKQHLLAHVHLSTLPHCSTVTLLYQVLYNRYIIYTKTHCQIKVTVKTHC